MRAKTSMIELAIGIVGATGVVGESFLELIKKKKFLKSKNFAHLQVKIAWGKAIPSITENGPFKF